MCSLAKSGTTSCLSLAGLGSFLLVAALFRFGGHLLGPAHQSIFCKGFDFGPPGILVAVEGADARVFDSSLSSVSVVLGSVL